MVPLLLTINEVRERSPPPTLPVFKAAHICQTEGQPVNNSFTAGSMNKHHCGLITKIPKFLSLCQILSLSQSENPRNFIKIFFNGTGGSNGKII